MKARVLIWALVNLTNATAVSIFVPAAEPEIASVTSGGSDSADTDEYGLLDLSMGDAPDVGQVPLTFAAALDKDKCDLTLRARVGRNGRLLIDRYDF